MRSRAVHGTWKAAAVILAWQSLACAGADRTSAASIFVPAEERRPGTVNSPDSRATTRFDILTDRLSPKQLLLWKSLMTIVRATDEHGSPLYPKLHSLWKAATGSGHAIYVEIVERKGGILLNPANTYQFTAGKFIREKTDGEGHLQPAVIRLDRSSSTAGCHTRGRTVSSRSKDSREKRDTWKYWVMNSPMPPRRFAIGTMLKSSRTWKEKGPVSSSSGAST